LFITPLFDTEGKLLYYLGDQYDVTTQVETETEIQRLDEDAAEKEVDRVGWPSFVMNEMSEVIVANRIVQRLWCRDASFQSGFHEDRHFRPRAVRRLPGEGRQGLFD
jgi:hypothetical protein